MKSTRAARKKIEQTTKVDAQTELAAKAATAITQAISQHGSRHGSKAGKEGITVHVHIGDVIMMGFDEAIDAEEWGARETSTEIVGGQGGKKAASGDESNDKNRNVKRRLTFRKGALELSAAEDSAPATREAVARKKTAVKKAPAAKKAASPATPRKSAKRPASK